VSDDQRDRAHVASKHRDSSPPLCRFAQVRADARIPDRPGEQEDKHLSTEKPSRDSVSCVPPVHRHAKGEARFVRKRESLVVEWGRWGGKLLRRFPDVRFRLSVASLSRATAMARGGVAGAANIPQKGVLQ
jgi:hypothetical protein